MSKELEDIKKIRRLLIKEYQYLVDNVEKAIIERDVYFQALCDIENNEDVRKVLERTLS